jgi:ATP-dependent Zn protease
VSRLLLEAEERARNLLSDNRGSLDAVVAALLEKETISGEELADIVNRTQAADDGQMVGTATPSASN